MRRAYDEALAQRDLRLNTLADKAGKAAEKVRPPRVPQPKPPASRVRQLTSVEALTKKREAWQQRLTEAE